MFAILITEENLVDIEESELLTTTEMTALKRYYTDRNVDWYFIRGYIGPRGNLEPFALSPGYTFEHTFDYDPEKIKTEWNQIVRL